MNHNSKHLGKNDTSGEVFSQEIFSQWEDKSLSFDRIIFDQKSNTWVLIDHWFHHSPILKDIPDHIQTNIDKTIDFLNYIQKKNISNIELEIHIFFPKNSSNETTVQKVILDPISKKISLPMISLELFVNNFRTRNYNASGQEPPYPSFNFDINYFKKRWSENNSFCISQASLMNDKTYGFNVDKIILTDDQVFMFELLKCEENQKVTPLTSHPNKYFTKNAQKFLSMFSFCQSMHSPFYCINYAEPKSNHGDICRFFEITSIDPRQQESPCTTNNIYSGNVKNLSNKIQEAINPSKPKNERKSRFKRT